MNELYLVIAIPEDGNIHMSGNNWNVVEVDRVDLEAGLELDQLDILDGRREE